MKKKQTQGLLAAAAIFVVVGVTSVMSNALSAKLMPAESESATAGFSSLMKELQGDGESILDDMPTTEDFIAVVPVRGSIQASSDSSGFSQSLEEYNHDLLMDYVNRLIDSDKNKGIILRMDTPGGTVYHSDELYLKLKEYKEKTERPIWVYMESYCCSGGVYIASVADEQYANRITTTGSIGVIMSNYDTTKLYKKLGIKTDNIVSGNNKDMGAGGKSMTDEQRAIYQSVVDEYYERFVEIVAEGRDMSVEEVKKLADGRIYTAEQATENGLIDGIKQSEEFDEYVKAQSGVDYFYEPKSNKSYWSDLFAQIKSMKTKSESEVLLEAVDQLGNGGPMYYAEPYSR